MHSPNPASNEHSERVSLFTNIWRVFGIAALLATLFTAWTPLGLVPYGFGDDFFSPPEYEPGTILEPTARPRPHIGIVAGHWQNDSGAVCADGYTEQKLNLEIATLVRNILLKEGYDVDLLAEFDEQLMGYKALTLVSIHADSCVFINAEASGFKVAAALDTSFPEKASRLTACLHSRYQESTGLKFHAGSITDDMTKNHTFNELHSETIAAIIEIGFMNLDRPMLTQNQDSVAQGIADGILCYIQNEDASLPTATPEP